jgi:UDP-N-acetylglucosamine 4,6-dehydratase
MFKSDPNRFTKLFPAGNLNNKTILITGGTGSFGKAFVSACLDQLSLKKLIIFSRDEQKQFEMAEEFAHHKNYTTLRFFIGDIRDIDRLELAMRDVDYVIHAAALKHVPIAEYNPFECIQTNVQGTQNVVMAALRNKVPRVLMLSTDKAVNPVNLYGASKLSAEKIIIASNHLSGTINTRFSVVRYGNVVASRGSVIPLFRRFIDKGEKFLPITDARMTRFWLRLEEGVNFVLSSMELMRGGEIFVPKIPSMKVIDIARWMAPHLEHKIIGIRPGEKLHEMLLTQNESPYTTELQDRYVVQPFSIFMDELKFDSKTGRKVLEDFYYSSDQNPTFLDSRDLPELFQGMAA